jgi:hypothetical protein
MLTVEERVVADRMWRDVEFRKAFERDTGLTDDSGEPYHSEFVAWATAKLRCPYADLSGPGGGCRYPKCRETCLGRNAEPLA